MASSPPTAADGPVARRLPALRGVCVPGTGHDPHPERPEVLHRLLAGFLAELPAEPSCVGVGSSS